MDRTKLLQLIDNMSELDTNRRMPHNLIMKRADQWVDKISKTQVITNYLMNKYRLACQDKIIDENIKYLYAKNIELMKYINIWTINIVRKYKILLAVYTKLRDKTVELTDEDGNTSEIMIVEYLHKMTNIPGWRGRLIRNRICNLLDKYTFVTYRGMSPVVIFGNINNFIKQIDSLPDWIKFLRPKDNFMVLSRVVNMAYAIDPFGKSIDIKMERLVKDNKISILRFIYNSLRLGHTGYYKTVFVKSKKIVRGVYQKDKIHRTKKIKNIHRYDQILYIKQCMVDHIYLRIYDNLRNDPGLISNDIINGIHVLNKYRKEKKEKRISILSNNLILRVVDYIWDIIVNIHKTTIKIHKLLNSSTGIGYNTNEYNDLLYIYNSIIEITESDSESRIDINKLLNNYSSDIIQLFTNDYITINKIPIEDIIDIVIDAEKELIKYYKTVRSNSKRKYVINSGKIWDDFNKF